MPWEGRRLQTAGAAFIFRASGGEIQLLPHRGRLIQSGVLSAGLCLGLVVGVFGESSSACSGRLLAATTRQANNNRGKSIMLSEMRDPSGLQMYALN